MKVIKLKHKGDIMYFPNIFPQSINKSGVLSYFIKGQGYTKTKKFEILPVELPDRWTKMSWLEIAKITDTYGLEVGDEYASCKTEGIVSRQTIAGYCSVYRKIKHLNPDNSEFFETLRCDYMLACFGMLSFDIVACDKALAKLDSEYNADEATYKGESCSMNQYVLTKYGVNAVAMITALNHVHVF